MAKHWDSTDPNEPGQYPAGPSFTLMGLPAQDFGSGAPGSSFADGTKDAGATNQPAQYPQREGFTGVPLGGSGAPGSGGVKNAPPGAGTDDVAATKLTTYKSIAEVEDSPDAWAQPDGQGDKIYHGHANVAGVGDWTQANNQSYGAGVDLPGVKGNTPYPGTGRQFQTGDGNSHIMYGGFLNGKRPARKQRPDFSGPGT